MNTFYYQLPERRSEATFGAIVQMLLNTRLRLHLETHEQMYDEDVNTYLAGLLVSYIDPRYLSAISEVLSQHDIDVFQSADKAAVRYHAYWIYKVNADDLLVSLGIFRGSWQQSQGEVIRMKRYYAAASEYQRRIYGKLTAVGEIQTKLSEGTERYLAILEGTRRDYLHFIERLPPEELAVLSQSLRQLEEEVPIKAAQDELLDLYSTWLKGSQDPDTRQRLLDLAEQLRRLSPTFQPEAITSKIKKV